MSQHIEANTARVFKKYEHASLKIKRAVEQLSSGKSIIRPGDERVFYERAAKLDLERATENAKMYSIQSQLAWFEASTSSLKQIEEVIAKMSKLSMNARSGYTSNEDRQILDIEFQNYKEQLSFLIDGGSGQKLSAASFGTTPMFLGYTPQSLDHSRWKDEIFVENSLNLYTAHQTPGFYELPLLDQGQESTNASYQATALGGSLQSLTLPDTAPFIDDVYVGMSISIDSGTGSGQSAVIASYDAQNRVVTFESPMAIAPDASSSFSIQSKHLNKELYKIAGMESLSFASHIWGADNDRFEHLDGEALTFRALSEEEVLYRQANSIADTDLIPRTNQEKILRRQLNIFDPEYGSLKDPAASEKMFTQLRNASEQISLLITREDAKAQSVRSQYDHYERKKQEQSLGIQNFSEVDFTKTASDYEKLKQAHNLVLEIVARIHENFQRFNELVKSGGKRR